MREVLKRLLEHKTKQSGVFITFTQSGEYVLEYNFQEEYRVSRSGETLYKTDDPTDAINEFLKYQNRQ